MQSNVNPTTGPLVTGPFQTDGSLGRDHYRDYGVDAGYQFLGDGTHIVTVQGIYTYESQNLEGTTNTFNEANGTFFGPKSNLNQIRMNAANWFPEHLWRNTRLAEDLGPGRSPRCTRQVPL